MDSEQVDFLDWLVIQLARDRQVIATQLQVQHNHLIDEARRRSMPHSLFATSPVKGSGKQIQAYAEGEATFQLEGGSPIRNFSMPENEVSQDLPIGDMDCLPKHAQVKRIEEQKQTNGRGDAIFQLEKGSVIGNPSMLEHGVSQDVPTGDMDVLPKNTQVQEVEEQTTDSRMDTGNTEEQNATKAQAMASVLRNHVKIKTRPNPHACCTNVVTHPMFEIASSMLILANIVVMACEMQYRGLKIGYEQQLEIGAYDPNAWGSAHLVFPAVEQSFNVIFAVELVLRFIVFKVQALKSVWIHLDIVVVCASFLAAFDVSTVDPSMIRVVRLARMIRVLKVVRVVRSFDSMFFLIRSIQASASAFVWSFILLCFVQLAAGMFLHQLLKPFMTDAQFPVKQREDIYNIFGTFTKTMLTMFEITFANWVPVCRKLVDNVAELYGLFFIFYRCMFCFAVVKVIAAVFISETNRIVAGDTELALVKSQRAREDYTRKLKTMFQVLDKSGDGKLSWSEFQHLLSDDVTKSWATAMEIDTRELEELFTFLDTGDGEVTLDEFMDGIPKMRGNARSTDVIHMLAVARRMEVKVNAIQDIMDSQRTREEHTAFLRDIRREESTAFPQGIMNTERKRKTHLISL